MPVQITSSNYNGQNAVVTLYSPTGNTIPYSSATPLSLGVKTIPFTYSASTDTNDYGTFQMEITGFTPSKICSASKLAGPDGDGNYYKTIKIGSQIWMSENLKTTKFQNGTSLSNNSQVDNATWAAATASNKYWAYVNGNSANTATYGLLYNQYAVTGSTSGATASVNLCPAGWRVPTDADFTQLNTSLGALGGSTGTQMKSTTLWASNGNGTNSSGFNGLPPGLRYTNGEWYDFSSFGFFWTTYSGVHWDLYYSNATFSQYSNSSVYGFSVRCLRN